MPVLHILGLTTCSKILYNDIFSQDISYCMTFSHTKKAPCHGSQPQLDAFSDLSLNDRQLYQTIMYCLLLKPGKPEDFSDYTLIFRC